MKDLRQEALDFHSRGKKGKIGISLTKKIANQKDLALAYSPGVAEPCLEIQKNYSNIYEYTSKGNFVAVVSNGTAVLGLGNLGAAASKPVMEGKAALFKYFAGIDAIDIEVDEKDPVKFVEIVKKIGVSWGGINLEDIKSPECFDIENNLQDKLDIPVFHDDQHGTAIVTVAGLINAAHITNRDIKELKIVVNGAGAAAHACVNLIKTLGVNPNNILVCDTEGVLYKGRVNKMNKWKDELSVNTDSRTLKDAMSNADVFIGLSVGNVISQEMIKLMAPKPIVFAMANPVPEIWPEKVYEVREDAIVATGRSDYKNQLNNFICFPYLFRGALDVRATVINPQMKIAAAHALAALARKEVTEEVNKTLGQQNIKFGADYIIPSTFDSRLITEVSIPVAKAAMESGVARKVINDFALYKHSLEKIVQDR